MDCLDVTSKMMVVERALEFGLAEALARVAALLTEVFLLSRSLLGLTIWKRSQLLLEDGGLRSAFHNLVFASSVGANGFRSGALRGSGSGVVGGLGGRVVGGVGGGLRCFHAVRCSTCRSGLHVVGTPPIPVGVASVHSMTEVHGAFWLPGSTKRISLNCDACTGHGAVTFCLAFGSSDSTRKLPCMMPTVRGFA